MYVLVDELAMRMDNAVPAKEAKSYRFQISHAVVKKKVEKETAMQERLLQKLEERRAKKSLEK